MTTPMTVMSVCGGTAVVPAVTPVPIDAVLVTGKVILALKQTPASVTKSQINDLLVTDGDHGDNS